MASLAARRQGASVAGPQAAADGKARWCLRHAKELLKVEAEHEGFFAAWTNGITKGMLDDRASLAVLLATAATFARRAEAIHARASNASWRSWLLDGPAALKRQHMVSRAARHWVPAVVAPVSDDLDGCDPEALLHDAVKLDSVSQDTRDIILGTKGVSVQPLSRQQTVDGETDKWSAEWLAGNPYPHLPWPEQLGALLPTPTVDDLIGACCTFPAGTGMGWDGLHPRALARLPEAVLHALMCLLLTAESIGHWPAAIGPVLIALLPKTDGGLRPIGLFPTPVRVWMRLRLDVAQEWMRQHERPFFFAGATKGATVATWKQAARAEVAAAADADFGAGLLDLIKAFERVPHEILVAMAQVHEYSL